MSAPSQLEGGQVRLEALTKSFGSLVAVDQLELEVDAGSFVALLGPSGCGKTTTLRMLVGLERPSSGRIWIDGEDITRLPPGRRKVGLVFQDFAIFPHMTVAANLSFALRMAGERRSLIDERVGQVAETLHIVPLLGRRPADLNPSELQRVSIGRTLVSRPQTILYDEPLSNVEAGLRARMRGQLKALHQELGQTSIYVTHDQVEALALADRVAVMDRARLLQVGTPDEVYNDPSHVFVAGFMGSPPMNLLEGTVEVDGEEAWIGAQGLRFRLGAQPPPDGFPRQVTVGMRPEHLRLGAADGSSDPAGRGEIVAVEPMGLETVVLVGGGSWELTVLLDGGAPDLDVGESVGVFAAPADLRIFDRAGGGRSRLPTLEASSRVGV